MKIRNIAAAVACAFLASCVNFTYSKKELIATGKTNPDVCSSEPLSVVESRFDKYFGRCFRNIKIIVNGANVSAQYYVAKSGLNNQVGYTVTTPIMYKPAYMLAVDLQGKEDDASCKTSIKAVAFNKMWEEHFNNLSAIASGAETDCPPH